LFRGVLGAGEQFLVMGRGTVYRGRRRGHEREEERLIKISVWLEELYGCKDDLMEVGGASEEWVGLLNSMECYQELWGVSSSGRSREQS